MNYLSHPVLLQQPAVGREGGPSELCPFPQDELEHSLGESAAQGAAGVVLWVSWQNTRTKVSSGPGGRLGWGQGWKCQADWQDPDPPFVSLRSWLASRSVPRCPR